MTPSTPCTWKQLCTLERLGGIDLRVTVDEVHAGDVGLLHDGVGDELHERDVVTQRDVSDLLAFTAARGSAGFEVGVVWRFLRESRSRNGHQQCHRTQQCDEP